MMFLHRIYAVWLDRTAREQWMMGLMFGLIGAVLIWYGVVKPLQGLADATSVSAQQEQTRLLRLGGKVAEAKSLGTQRSKNLRADLEQAARQASVYPTISTNDDGQVTIELDRSPDDQALRYLAELGRTGVVLDGLRITRADDNHLRVVASVYRS